MYKHGTYLFYPFIYVKTYPLSCLVSNYKNSVLSNFPHQVFLTLNHSLITLLFPGLLHEHSLVYWAITFLKCCVQNFLYCSRWGLSTANYKKRIMLCVTLIPIQFKQPTVTFAFSTTVWYIQVQNSSCPRLPGTQPLSLIRELSNYVLNTV